jgi:tetratricopeptide (TPR) repeat protein
MTQQNNDLTEEHNRLIQEATEQIEQQEYLAAVNNLEYVTQNNEQAAYAFFLKGEAYVQMKKYKLALTNYETALYIYRAIEDKRSQIRTLSQLSFIYIFNGKTQEGFFAQQQIIKIAKEIDLAEEDPLYPLVSSYSQISNENLDQMTTALQKLDSISGWGKFNVMGKMMGYASKGKPQSFLFTVVGLILEIPILIISAPIWLPITLYQIWRRR